MEAAKDIRDSVLYKTIGAKFDVELNYVNGKKIIKPIPKWKTITTDVTSDRDNIAIRTGKINNIICIDLDKPKDGELDGIRYFEDNVGKIEELNTLVTQTIGGGYHIYYKYTNKLRSTVKLVNINNTISIDIRNDDAIAFEGKSYDLICDAEELQEVPETLLALYKLEDRRLKMEQTIGNEKLPNDSIKLMLDNLDFSYHDNYQKWINVLCVLKNINCDLGTAKYFSKKNEKKYNEKYLENLWKKLETRDSPAIGTLYYFLKLSVGKNKYDSLMKKLKKASTAEDNLMSIDDYKCYQLFKEQYKNELMSIDNVLYSIQESSIWKPIRTNEEAMFKRIYDFKFSIGFLRNKDMTTKLPVIPLVSNSSMI